MNVYLFALSCFAGFSVAFGRGVNGGIGCAACTIVTGLVEQLSYLKGESLVKSLERLCGKLPVEKDLCLTFAHSIEPLLANKRFLELFTPDIFCYAVDSCHRDDGQQYCHLFPRPHHSFNDTVYLLKEVISESGLKEHVQQLYQDSSSSDGFTDRGVDFCRLPLVKEVCNVFLHFADTLKPAADADGDGHSVISQARGADWRGKDCDDLDPKVHPGAIAVNYDKHRDSNCNGIYGVDPMSGTPWEQKLCPTKVGSRGLIYIGDSFGAHFHFPRSWLDAKMIDSVTAETVTDAVLDELDWPEVSYATGFSDQFPPMINMKKPETVVDSIYLRMRARNRCNHRDYANLSQNGAAARDFSYIVNETLIRNKTSDKPALVLYAFMGNDVCNRFHDTVGNMTPPADFRENVLTTLNILNQKLPNGSHIVLMGLLDGSFIYPEMAERIHPIGSVLDNVRYKNVYDWFTCMEIGPCNGWMTRNATLRRITSQWSARLNDVLRDIAENSSYSCCELHYVESPAQKAVNWWTKNGRSASELIEPVDSVHPNQIAQSVIAQMLWNDLFENLPREVVGPLNPSNRKIKRLFGNQGGH